MSGTRAGRGRDPFTYPLEQRVAMLGKRMLDMEVRIGEVARAVPNEHTMRLLVLDACGKEYAHLEKLLGDAVRILTLLVEKGLVTQEELNRAVRGE